MTADQHKAEATRLQAAVTRARNAAKSAVSLADKIDARRVVALREEELRQLDVLPPSAYGCRLRGKDGDSCFQTATSRRGNVLARVDVAMMHRAAIRTNPLPYSQLFQPARAAMEDVLTGSPALFLEPRSVYDRAILGIAERADGMMVVAYDALKVMFALVEAEGWSGEEALEWYGCNTSSAWVGPGTPVFVTAIDRTGEDVAIERVEQPTSGPAASSEPRPSSAP